MKRLLIIPAAGMGRRLQASVPKVLYPVGGRPALDYLLDLYEPVVEHTLLVLHPSFEPAVQRYAAGRGWKPDIVFQDPPSGMLPAILLPRQRVATYAPAQVWVTWCDQVAIHPRTVERLAALCESDPSALTFPTVWKDNPYIHLVRDDHGTITDVLQHREGDRLPARGESDSGLFCLSQEAYVDLLEEYSGTAPRGARTGEANFLPFIPWVARRRSVRTFLVEHEMESVGINTLDDVAQIEGYLRERE